MNTGLLIVIEVIAATFGPLFPSSLAEQERWRRIQAEERMDFIIQFCLVTVSIAVVAGIAYLIYRDMANRRSALLSAADNKNHPEPPAKN